MMFSKYFEYNTIIIGGSFFREHAVDQKGVDMQGHNAVMSKQLNCTYFMK